MSFSAGQGSVTVSDSEFLQNYKSDSWHLILHLVDSTTFRHFYKPKVRILALNLNWNLIASSMIALFPFVLDVAVSRVWTCSS